MTNKIEFEAGDVVRHICYPDYGVGHILDIPDPVSFAVNFEFETRAAHDCGGFGDRNHCWWSWPNNLELLVRPSELVPDVTKLRVKSRKWYHHNFEIGSIVTFHRTGGYRSFHAVNDSHVLQVLHPDDFEVIRATPAAIKKPRTFDLNSQVGRILAHLVAGNSITPLQAFGVFGTFRLAARIKELRDAGHKIKTVIKRDPNGRPYAEYSLRNAGRFL